VEVELKEEEMATNPLWTILVTPGGPYVFSIQPAIDQLAPPLVQPLVDAMLAEDPNRDVVEATASATSTAGAVAVGVIVEAIEAFLDFPADWVDTPGWDVSVSPGDPHPTLMARRVNADVDALPPIPGLTP
jgi:hypothetical protein